MVPGTDLSDLRNIIIIARISRNGSPAAAAGDLEGQAVLATPGGNIKVTIDRLVK